MQPHGESRESQIPHRVFPRVRETRVEHPSCTVNFRLSRDLHFSFPGISRKK